MSWLLPLPNSESSAGAMRTVWSPGKCDSCSRGESVRHVLRDLGEVALAMVA